MPDLSGLASAEQIEQLEDLAFNGAEMPKGLHFPEQLLFLRFRCLYAYARQIQMDPEQGKREKQEIVTEYIGNLANHILYMGSAERWKNCEAAASEIRKDPDVYNIPKVRALMFSLYGEVDRPRGEESV